MSQKIEVNQIESYLFAENKQEFLKTLVQGTYEYGWFKLIDSINSNDKLRKEDETLLSEFLQNYGENVYIGGQYKRLHPIQLKLLLKEFTQSNEQRKQEIIKELQTQYFTDISTTHSKPSEIGITNEQKQSEANLYKSELEEQLFSLYNYIKDLYTTSYKHQNIKNISPDAYSQVDPSKFSGEYEIKTLESFFQNADLFNLQDQVIGYCVQYWKKYKQVNKDAEHLPEFIYEKLTLQQLEKLGNEIPTLKSWSVYAIALFKKMFSKDLKSYEEKQNNDLTKQEKIEKKKLLLKILEWSKANTHSNHYSLKDQLVYEILNIGLELGEYDKDLFLEYLKQPMRYNSSGLPFIEAHYRKLIDMKRNIDTQWQSAFYFPVNKWYRDKDLLEQYLNEFFKTSENLKPYDEYLETSYLSNLYYISKLRNGQTFQNINQLLPEQTINNLMSQKEITICQSNNKFFKAGEEVSLLVDLKNIQDLTIKCFEINTENYYLKNSGPFDNSLNLEGINPLGQQANMKINENPMKVVRKLYQFEKITQMTRGVFVVEFIGNGITSRAIIKKGGLAFLEQKTISGNLVTLISEDRNVCIPSDQDHTGLYLKGRFLKANKNGQVMIPYGESSQNCSIILVHDDFADLGNIQLEMEFYQFKTAYLYHSETFLRGNKAKIIIQPRLYINGLPASYKLMEEFQINAVLINEQNIPNTYQFKSIKLDHKEDIEIEIPIQNLVKNIKININGKIKKMNGQYQNFVESHNIDFDIYTNDQFTNLYLKEREQGYSIFCLGKNGEPKRDVIIDLSIKNKFISNQFSSTLKTNENGEIILGKMPEVEHITANLRQLNDIQKCSKNWHINNRTNIDYPSTLYIAEGDIITLPAQTSDLNQHQYYLYQHEGCSVLQDCLSNIIYGQNKIAIKGLQEGNYILRIKKISHEIRIKVIKGEYWTKSKAYIVQDRTNYFYELTSTISQNLMIVKTSFEESKKNQDLRNVVIELNLPENVHNNQQELELIRVHVFAYNLSLQDNNQQAEKLRRNKILSEIGSSSFGSKKTVFLNNKQLGDEICYVIDRRNQKKFIGNTLEKPNILLKRTFVKDTNFEKEKLQSDIEYKQGLNERFQDTASKTPPKIMSACLPPLKPSNPGIDKIDSMLNFLEFPGYCQSNLKVGVDGKVIIQDFPYKQYSSLQIIVSNLSANIQETVPIPNNNNKYLARRDLRLVSNLYKNVPYCEKRGSIQICKNKSQQIKADSECVIIDNLGQLFEIQKELAITLRGEDSENGGYKFWDFVRNWQSLSEDEKMKKYDEYACHEINIFVFFKDRQFFDRIVKNFLKNKIEKTFVDYFLIDDFKNLMKFSSPEQIIKLNYLERNLLIMGLMKNNQSGVAQQIAECMDQQIKSKILDTGLRKKLYDTVISAKSKSTGQVKMKKFEQQIQKEKEEERKLILQNPHPELRNFGMRDQMMDMKEKIMDDCEDELMGQKLQVNRRMSKPKSRIMAERSSSPKFFSMSRSRESVQVNMMCSMAMDESMPMQANMQNFGMAGLDDEFTEKLIEQRKNFNQGYQKLKSTKEYIERTYYGLKNPRLQSSLIEINSFWTDLAKYIVQNKGKLENFLSENFIYANTNHAEMITVLAFLDLDFLGGDFEIESRPGRKLEIIAGQNSNLIIFQKDITQCEQNINASIALTQRYFDPKDRFTYLEDDPDNEVEKDILEFKIDKVYGLQTIITNCSVANLEFQVLTEIPEGSIPIRQVDYTKSNTLQINSYTTQKLECYFYFPQSGQYGIYPGNVSRNEVIQVNSNDIGTILVQEDYTIKKMESFIEIVRNGKNEDILKFIQEKNILNEKVFKFEYVYWKLRDDKRFYEELIVILQKRQLFDYTTWSYSLYHQDYKNFCQLFNSSQFQHKFFSQNRERTDIKYLNEKYLKIDSLQLFEYHPLLSSRCHNFMNQKKSKILNIEFKQTYEKFVRYLSEVGSLQPEHYIAWSYYLLLQERIEESIKVFQKINPQSVSEKANIQYQYMKAYLNIYSGDASFKQAREIAEQFKNYPVLSWRNLFLDLHNQLTEYDGDKVQDKDQIKDAELNKNLKTGEKEQSFSVEVDKTTLVIQHQNLREITINLYEIDLEILFSRTPFINKDKNEFSFVKANYTEKVALVNQQILSTKKYVIPKEFQQKNLFIQMKSVNKIQSVNYYSNQLKVNLIENYGQVKVMDENGNSLSKVYVKTFARDKKGVESFYRDGYTDLRGRFDYALSSSSDINSIAKFSILICSENFGSLIKEAGIPSQLGSMGQTLSSQ